MHRKGYAASAGCTSTRQRRSLMHSCRTAVGWQHAANCNRSHWWSCGHSGDRSAPISVVCRGTCERSECAFRCSADHFSYFCLNRNKRHITAKFFPLFHDLRSLVRFGGARNAPAVRRRRLDELGCTECYVFRKVRSAVRFWPRPVFINTSRWPATVLATTAPGDGRFIARPGSRRTRHRIELQPRGDVSEISDSRCQATSTSCPLAFRPGRLAS
jgi:hypothetical protein